MSERSDDELDNLLARGALGGPGREQVLRNVLAALPAAAPPWRRQAIAGVCAFTAVAAAAVLVSWPRAGRQTDAMRIKGAGPAAAVRLDLGCAGAGLEACPIGATLVFAVAGATRPGYLAAYAEPMTPGGERIWYFSSVAAPAIGSGPGTHTSSQGVRVGHEHRPGEYLVHLLLTNRPSSKEALRGPEVPGLIGRSTVRLRVVAP
jgi:hypothetical protein